jgi:hypothetical protein
MMDFLGGVQLIGLPDQIDYFPTPRPQQRPYALVYHGGKQYANLATPCQDSSYPCILVPIRAIIGTKR